MKCSSSWSNVSRSWLPNNGMIRGGLLVPMLQKHVAIVDDDPSYPKAIERVLSERLSG